MRLILLSIIPFAIGCGHDTTGDDTHPDADFDSMHGKVCTHSAPAPHARPSSLTVK